MMIETLCCKRGRMPRGEHREEYMYWVGSISKRFDEYRYMCGRARLRSALYAPRFPKSRIGIVNNQIRPCTVSMPPSVQCPMHYSNNPLIHTIAILPACAEQDLEFTPHTFKSKLDVFQLLPSGFPLFEHAQQLLDFFPKLSLDKVFFE